MPIDHVGVAVRSIEESAPVYELVTGAVRSEVEAIPEQGVRVSFVGEVELLEPTAPDTPIGRFLDRRAPGLHHIAFRVPDLRTELARWKAAGHELIDETPRPGAGGHLVAFLHPRDAGGVLIELVEG